MESVGFSADAALLDKIMDLYVESRKTGSEPGASPGLRSTARNWGDEVPGDQSTFLPPSRAAAPRDRPAAAAAGSLTGPASSSLRPGTSLRPNSRPSPTATPPRGPAAAPVKLGGASDDDKGPQSRRASSDG